MGPLRRAGGGRGGVAAARGHVRASARGGRSGRATAHPDRVGHGPPRGPAAAARRPCTTGSEDRTVLAVDGKTLRGARDQRGEQVKLVAVFDHAEHLALAQVEVVDGDELAAFTPALNIVPALRGAVVTGDALYCQRAHAEYLHARGAHYLFTVKGNQPTLRRALARLPWAQAPGQRERTIGRGRTEFRSIKVIDRDGTDEYLL